MGLNYAYEKDGDTILDGKPIQEGEYEIVFNGKRVKAWITVVSSKQFKIKTRRAYITLMDDTTLDVVKNRIKIDVPGSPHRIPGEGAWNGSGGMTCC